MFLVNSRQKNFSCALLMVPLARNLTGRASCELTPSLFAEFLRDQSLVGLRLLAPPTCVGFGTVSIPLSLEDFLESMLDELRPNYRASLFSLDLEFNPACRICQTRVLSKRH